MSPIHYEQTISRRQSMLVPRPPRTTRAHQLYLPPHQAMTNSPFTRQLLKLASTAVIIFLAACGTMKVDLSPSNGPKITVSAAAAKRMIMVLDGSAAAIESKDWSAFKAEWQKAMTASAATVGATVRYQDTAAVEGVSEPTTLVVVHVNDYRYITQSARFAVGIMTGNAFVDADVSALELPGKTSAGARQYKTTSSAGQGIFSPMTEKQLAAISDDIVRELVSR